MLTNCTKLLIGASVILSFVLGILGGIVIGRALFAKNVNEPSEDQAPIRVVTLTINPDQREQLFAEMERFADKWAYAIRIDPAESNEKYSRVDLWRADIKVLGLYSEGVLDLAFSYTDPTHSVPEKYFDEEINDLESFVNEIADMKISREK
jgi:hypothetical protein